MKYDRVSLYSFGNMPDEVRVAFLRLTKTLWGSWVKRGHLIRWHYFGLKVSVLETAYPKEFTYISIINNYFERHTLNEHRDNIAIHYD